MINILLAVDNIYYARTLMDTLADSIEDVRILYITIDGKETLERLNTNDNIDIVILDLELLNGIDAIRNLSTEKRKKYNNSIIVISKKTKLLSEIVNDDTIYDVINKLHSMSEIIKKIDKLVKNKEKIKNAPSLKSRIIQELQEVGYNLSHKGTLYLLDAIYLAYINDLEDDLNLRQNIYPLLSQKYNRPIYCIKGDIIKATDCMDSICELNKKKEYFSFCDNTKPTVKLVIYTVLNNLHSRL